MAYAVPLPPSDSAPIIAPIIAENTPDGRSDRSPMAKGRAPKITWHLANRMPRITSDAWDKSSAGELLIRVSPAESAWLAEEKSLVAPRFFASFILVLL